MRLWHTLLFAVLAAGCSPATTDTPPPREETRERPGLLGDTEEVEPATFHGYDCTEDCSGHEAGYEWAAEQGITDPDDCSGNSESFIEGCRAYAEEQGGGSDGDDDPYAEGPF